MVRTLVPRVRWRSRVTRRTLSRVGKSKRAEAVAFRSAVQTVTDRLASQGFFRRLNGLNRRWDDGLVDVINLRMKWDRCWMHFGLGRRDHPLAKVGFVPITAA